MLASSIWTPFPQRSRWFAIGQQAQHFFILVRNVAFVNGWLVPRRVLNEVEGSWDDDETEGLGRTDKGTGSSVGGRGEKKREGLLSHFRLRGSLHVTRIRCTARHEWQWWALWAQDPAFSTPTNSPSQAPLSLWQDEETSCQLKYDSLCLTLTHSFTRSPTLFLSFQPLCGCFVYLFCLISFFQFAQPHCFFLILVSLLTHLLFNTSLVSHPFILPFCPSFSIPLLFLHSS